MTSPYQLLLSCNTVLYGPGLLCLHDDYAQPLMAHSKLHKFAVNHIKITGAHIITTEAAWFEEFHAALARLGHVMPVIHCMA